ncbi:MAG: hypothetical protein J6X53_00350, partial [Abditibacteriota bacterium]|nr:hypothetical protein [Abditibacteriota bacterium]
MKRFALAALMVCVASVPILSAKTAKKSAPKNTKTTAAKKVTAKKQPAAKPAAQAQSAASAKVGDAYAVKRSGNSWAIGTDAVEVEYTLRDGRFLVTGFTNKKTAPAKKYVTAANPVDMGVEVFNTSGDDYSCDALKTVKLGEGADSAEVSVDSVEVKKGDKIGMVVDSQGEYSGDHVEWGTTVTYTDGDSYNSADDVDAVGLEVWGYYAYDTNSGGLVLMEDRLTTTTKQRVASPTQASGYRVGPYEPFVGSTQFHPSNGAAAVRVFTAPKDGTISVRGNAKRLGTGGTDVKIAKLVKRDNSNSIKRNYKYTLVSAQPSKTAVGGSSCVRLDITMNQTSLEDPADTSVYRYHVTAFPKTGVLRQWADIDNKTKSPVSINPVLQNIAIKNTQGKYTASWMTGETVDRTQGLMYHADLGKDMGKSISATASAGLMPWMGIKSGDVSEDGIYTAPDYMGTWNILANRGENGNIILSSSAPDRKNDKLQPGTSLRLPYVAFGVFAGGYDDMMRDLYTWQYTYLWDYTHIEWFAKTPFTVAWYGDSDNCAMKFCGHLGQLDMDTTDEVRTAGMDVLWEDAGWSAVCHWWDASFEGPDFALTRRYLEKNGMKLLVWMQGHQTNGLTSSKVASWGNIQRRTDGMGFSRNIDIKLRYQTETFLDRHPRASFHTCSGGSNYSHLFEIQRYTDVNYDADGPAADYTNAYWSYAELPDKWFDNMNPWGYPRDYEDNILWRMLTQVPKWGLDITDHDIKEMALIVDLYKYLLKEGVAGRWSFMPHPVVKGDEKDYNYGQRMNYDGTKGLIVLKDTPKANVTVYPRGLVGNKTYLVQCEKQNYTQTRVGKDLMMNGVDVAANTVGEIIYLNLPGRPRGKSDTVAPSAPDTVYAKRESNVGFAGMGIYWSAAKDNNYISYYEVKRGDTVLGVAGTGHYYFDRTEGWSETADYYVRTVDGDRNVSEWKLAKRIADEPDTYTALGGHYKEAGRRGWKFETTKDEITFTGSTWVKPVKAPGADKGGTTIQEGGADGW